MKGIVEPVAWDNDIRHELVLFAAATRIQRGRGS